MGKVTAFIPVRGGSKSIPLKNIKLFCGKPLVYWTISALQQTDDVDEIIVATDSEEIENAVNSFNREKVRIYRRSAENAVDTASTESVMLEYLTYTGLGNSENLFILVQATSPLIQNGHLKEALEQYRESNIDSLLTCTRSVRFYWNEDGTPKNYDYMNRPRRQDFKGELQENGAFYISSCKKIFESGNRLSGNIGIYEMPPYTSFEMDEEDDWLIMETLMKKHVLSKRTQQERVKNIPGIVVLENRGGEGAVREAIENYLLPLERNESY